MIPYLLRIDWNVKIRPKTFLKITVSADFPPFDGYFRYEFCVTFLPSKFFWKHIEQTGSSNGSEVEL